MSLSFQFLDIKVYLSTCHCQTNVFIVYPLIHRQKKMTVTGSVLHKNMHGSRGVSVFLFLSGMVHGVFHLQMYII